MSREIKLPTQFRTMEDTDVADQAITEVNEAEAAGPEEAFPLKQEEEKELNVRDVAETHTRRTPTVQQKERDAAPVVNLTISQLFAAPRETSPEFTM
jgi:hypothetical protein